MEDQIQYLNDAKNYSNDRLKALKEDFQKFNDAPVCALTFGSFARREATTQSDLDYIVITDNEKLGLEVLSQFPNILKKQNIKSPSSGGAFGGISSIDNLTHNIGGRDEGNDTLTKRLLFLLESECLVGHEIYDDIQDKLINMYVKDTITQHQICRFLLNDLIRYYRTICVDFEYKTCDLFKSWGDRNIKLLFSRKLLYFSGVLSVAQTAQSTYTYKRNVLKHLFNLTPIERITEICGSKAYDSLKLYSDFIGCIGNENMRCMLNNTNMDRTTHCEEFRTYKNKGQYFTWALSKLLEDTYDKAHPIHIALKF